MTEKYISITTVSTYRHRYVLPVSEIQKLKPDYDFEEATKWMAENIHDGYVDEFSQLHLGETIVDNCVFIDEDEIIKIFDFENDYLKGWTKEKKLDWIKNNLNVPTNRMQK